MPVRRNKMKDKILTVVQNNKVATTIVVGSIGLYLLIKALPLVIMGSIGYIGYKAFNHFVLRG